MHLLCDNTLKCTFLCEKKHLKKIRKEEKYAIAPQWWQWKEGTSKGGRTVFVLLLSAVKSVWVSSLCRLWLRQPPVAPMWRDYRSLHISLRSVLQSQLVFVTSPSKILAVTTETWSDPWTFFPFFPLNNLLFKRRKIYILFILKKSFP